MNKKNMFQTDASISWIKQVKHFSEQQYQVSNNQAKIG